MKIEITMRNHLLKIYYCEHPKQNKKLRTPDVDITVNSMPYKPQNTFSSKSMNSYFDMDSWPEQRMRQNKLKYWYHAF